MKIEQSYAAYQPSGYVQTGLGFDPSYGRTYATPVQRYDFQGNQIPPINQVVQGVSFAPTVTYAGQVSTGPAPMLLGGQSDLNKSMSGNDMPGYPRVNSVPPRSLNCNGYSGDFGGNQTNNNSIQTQQASQPNQAAQQQSSQQQQPAQPNNQNHMHVPQVPQSPSRSNVSTPIGHHNMMTSSAASTNHPIQHTNGNGAQQIQMQASGNHHGQQTQPPHSGYMSHPSNPVHGLQQSPSHNSQMQMPNHQNSGHLTQSPNHHMSHHTVGNNGSEPDWSWNNQTTHHHGGDMFNQSDRVNLNTKLKTMILSKNDQKDQTGHFLSFSHHVRNVNTDGDNNQNQQSYQLPESPARITGKYEEFIQNTILFNEIVRIVHTFLQYQTFRLICTFNFTRRRLRMT